MRSNVTETSIDCFHEVVIPSLAQSQNSKISAWALRQKEPFTRRQIASALDMETGTVSARVDALIAAKVLQVLRDSNGIKIKGVRPGSPVSSELVMHSLNAEKQLKLI